jgi:hypothetical protein
MTPNGVEFHREMTTAARTSWATGRIKDARGRRASQLDPVLLHLRHEHSRIPPGPLRSIARRIGLGMTTANRITMWASIVGLVCLVTGAVILSVRLSNGAISTRRFVGSMVPLTSTWVALYAFWMGTRGVRFQRTKRVMLEHGFCPHCGYDLNGLCVDATDGATVCPECGCAWSLRLDADAPSDPA